MVGMLLDPEHVMEAHSQRNDAAVHPAVERPKFLLYESMVRAQRYRILMMFSDYYGDTFFKSAGTKYGCLF